eukprot:snap_masked-scaffold_42-processed-gene-2.23-mRNA-1 protein AED:1.00 eAED:1.00 QI:0/-1/0/0/-1/1/1/0/333
MSQSICRVEYDKNISISSLFNLSRIKIVFQRAAIFFQFTETLFFLRSGDLLSLANQAELLSGSSFALQQPSELFSLPFSFDALFPASISSCDSELEVFFQQITGSPVQILVDITLNYSQNSNAAEINILSITCSTELFYQIDLVNALIFLVNDTNSADDPILVLHWTIYDSTYGFEISSSREGEIISYMLNYPKIHFAFEGLVPESTFQIQLRNNQLFKSRVKQITKSQEAGLCNFELLSTENDVSLFIFSWKVSSASSLLIEKESDLSRSFLLGVPSLGIGNFSIDLTISPANNESIFEPSTLSFYLDIVSSNFVTLVVLSGIEGLDFFLCS